MKTDEYYKMFEFENHYWWYRGLHELVCAFVPKISSGNPSQQPLKIFDAGCGTGRLMELLADYGDVAGLDYSPEAVELCRRRGLTAARQGDLNQWEPDPESYDVITSNDVICTSGVADDVAVLKTFYRALRPGGVLILNLPAFSLLRRRHDIAVFGKRRYRKYRTLRLLKEIGFRPVRATYRLAPLFFVFLAQKYLLEPFSRGEAVSDLKPLPRLLNGFLVLLHRMENRLVKLGLSFPMGTSLFLVCRKG